MNVRRAWMRAALPLTIVLILAACGSNGGDDGNDGNGGTSEGGEIFVSGSSTVEPVTNRVAEVYAESNADFQYTVEGPGTGDGFALFCNGETDISDASRPISEEEIATCEENGIEYVELLVAYDGLSVITSEENEAISCLSFLDLYALLGPESEGFDNWTDANDLAAELEEELGDELGASNAPYPDAPLSVTAPGEESGTFDSFVEIALEDIADARGTDPTTRADYTASANDNVIIEGITGSPTSLGWVGLAFAGEAEGVKLLEVDGGNGCVAPSDETVADESYPIARPLFIYPNLASVNDNPLLAPFIDFYVSAEGLALAGEVGYVALNDEQSDAVREAWEGR